MSRNRALAFKSRMVSWRQTLINNHSSECIIQAAVSVLKDRGKIKEFLTFWAQY